MTAKHKRNLFEELKQGITEVNAHRGGKLTLRVHRLLKKNPVLTSVRISFEKRVKIYICRVTFLP